MRLELPAGSFPLGIVADVAATSPNMDEWTEIVVVRGLDVEQYPLLMSFVLAR